MDLDYSICPHCGCRCEDDEFCAACGKLFHEKHHVVRDISTLGILGNFLCSLYKGPKRGRVSMEEDLNLDPNFSSTPGNIAYDLYNDEP